jgi:hypothetical protein
LQAGTQSPRQTKKRPKPLCDHSACAKGAS